jgi:hypothetical protein
VGPVESLALDRREGQRQARAQSAELSAQWGRDLKYSLLHLKPLESLAHESIHHAVRGRATVNINPIYSSARDKTNTLSPLQLVQFDQTSPETPYLVRSAKLSCDWPSQYCGGGPRWKPGCRIVFIFLHFFALYFFALLWRCAPLRAPLGNNLYSVNDNSTPLTHWHMCICGILR